LFERKRGASPARPRLRVCSQRLSSEEVVEFMFENDVPVKEVLWPATQINGIEAFPRVRKLFTRFDTLALKPSHYPSSTLPSVINLFQDFIILHIKEIAFSRRDALDEPGAMSSRGPFGRTV